MADDTLNASGTPEQQVNSEVVQNGPMDEKLGTDVSPEKEQELKKWFIGSIDQGTTSTRFLIFDGTGTPVASHQLEFKQIHQHSG